MLGSNRTLPPAEPAGPAAAGRASWAAEGPVSHGERRRRFFWVAVGRTAVFCSVLCVGGGGRSTRRGPPAPHAGDFLPAAAYSRLLRRAKNAAVKGGGGRRAPARAGDFCRRSGARAAGLRRRGCRRFAASLPPRRFHSRPAGRRSTSGDLHVALPPAGRSRCTQRQLRPAAGASGVGVEAFRRRPRGWAAAWEACLRA
jgi:hypothetical protein